MKGRYSLMANEKHTISFVVYDDNDEVVDSQSVNFSGSLIDACIFADFCFGIMAKTLEQEGVYCDDLPGLYAIGQKGEYSVVVDGRWVRFEGKWYDSHIKPAYVELPPPANKGYEFE